MFSHDLRLTHANEVMLVINKLTITKELGIARNPVTRVSRRIDRLQYRENAPVRN